MLEEVEKPEYLEELQAYEEEQFQSVPMGVPL